MTRRFLTLADVAEMLNVSASQAYALVRSGDLRAIKIGGRGQWRVEESELERFIAERYEQTERFIAEHPFTRSDESDATTPVQQRSRRLALVHERIPDRPAHCGGRDGRATRTPTVVGPQREGVGNDVDHLAGPRRSVEQVHGHRAPHLTPSAQHRAHPGRADRCRGVGPAAARSPSAPDRAAPAPLGQPPPAGTSCPLPGRDGAPVPDAVARDDLDRSRPTDPASSALHGVAARSTWTRLADLGVVVAALSLGCQQRRVAGIAALGAPWMGKSPHAGSHDRAVRGGDTELSPPTARPLASSRGS